MSPFGPRASPGPRASRLGLLAVAVLAASCRHAAPAPTADAAATPEEALARWHARQPERFKMVHQVSAKWGADGGGVVTGYMLGKKDGSFRVGAAISMGPRVFDVAHLDGQYASQVHLEQAKGKLDPLHVARAIEWTYFSMCEGGGERRGDRFVYRCAVSGGEPDTLEVDLDPRRLCVTEKRFLKGGEVVLRVSYEDLEPFGAEWLARRVHLQGREGYSVDIALVQYDPGFAFDDARLAL